ncbi:hypothetical protein [Streptomyces sp. NPDC058202]|uniref:hypothetical protein n=1 Tax=Streptomyces sp. NPDC058202 TaxID=3346380 RepID=UPI0036F02FF1
MSYRLIVTRPDGSLLQTSPDPLPTMTEVGLSALRVMGEEVGRVSIADVKRLGARIRDTPLGETVTHEPTGYQFRAEAFA